MKNKQELLNSLGNIYELSNNLSWEQEKKVLTAIDEIVENFNIYNDFVTYLDEREKLMITDRL